MRKGERHEGREERRDKGRERIMEERDEQWPEGRKGGRADQGMRSSEH